MPSNKSRNTLARQWELLKLLPTRGAGMTASEIVTALNDQGFPIDKRQVERDLKTLSEIFPLYCNDAGTPYGWRWSDHVDFDLSGMTVADALSTHLIEDMLKPLLPGAVLQSLEPRFDMARKKIAALRQENSNAEWVDKVRSAPATLPLQPPTIDPNVLETVQNCLLNNEQVKAQYQSASAASPSPTTLHPLALVRAGVAIYLVATAFNYPEVRIYALHRFSFADRSYQPANRPHGFNIDDYLQSGALQFGSAEPMQLKAHICPDLAKILQETPLAADQTFLIEENHTTITATVADTWQLHWWILSQGSGITIIEPLALRNDIADTLREAAGNY